MKPDELKAVLENQWVESYEEGMTPEHGYRCPSCNAWVSNKNVETRNHEARCPYRALSNAIEQIEGLREALEKVRDNHPFEHMGKDGGAFLNTINAMIAIARDALLTEKQE